MKYNVLFIVSYLWLWTQNSEFRIKAKCKKKYTNKVISICWMIWKYFNYQRKESSYKNGFLISYCRKRFLRRQLEKRGGGGPAGGKGKAQTCCLVDHPSDYLMPARGFLSKNPGLARVRRWFADLRVTSDQSSFFPCSLCLTQTADTGMPKPSFQNHRFFVRYCCIPGTGSSSPLYSAGMRQPTIPTL